MSELKELIRVIEVLRSPQGCKWDREQTHSTLKTNMLEEAYEAVDAINSGDFKHLKEELGDVLLQVVLHSQIAKENGIFDIEDVAKGIKEKLIRRHPHVFGDTKIKTTQDILDNWEKIKKTEKPHRKSVMSGISKSQSALMSALKISKKAVKVGFEWQDNKSLKECIFSEIKEFEEAPEDLREEEFGDMLFAIVNFARRYKIDPEQALLKSNAKFIKRFQKMEELNGVPLEGLSFEEYEELWAKAKKACLSE